MLVHQQADGSGADRALESAEGLVLFALGEDLSRLAGEGTGHGRERQRRDARNGEDLTNWQKCDTLYTVGLKDKRLSMSRYNPLVDNLPAACGCSSS